MALAALFYNSANAESVKAAQVARKYFKTKKYTITKYDTATKNEGAMLTLIDTITVNTLTECIIACPTQATYSAAGSLTYDQVAYLDSKMITASKGTVVKAGTCGANTTVTNIVTAGGSTVNDTYIGMYVKTAGTTAVYRYITAYTGSGTIATVATTTTAVTTTETYTVFSLNKIKVVGNASSNKLAMRVAFDLLFPNKDVPMIVVLLGGYGSTFKPYIESTVTATSANTTTLTHTSHFTAHAYIGKYVAIESGTLGVGQIRKITDNTVTVLTLDSSWTAPTGTIVYQISDTKEFALWNKYLPLAIATYLTADTAEIDHQWDLLLDKTNAADKPTRTMVGDDALLKLMADRGKVIFDAKCAGVVS